MYEALFQRIKSTDFPLQCRGMYYFSKGRHAHQERKGSGTPYFVHPRGVTLIVMEHGGTIDQINAALAHDLLESPLLKQSDRLHNFIYFDSTVRFLPFSR